MGHWCGLWLNHVGLKPRVAEIVVSRAEECLTKAAWG